MKVKVVFACTLDLEKVINTEISTIERSGYSVVDVQPLGMTVNVNTMSYVLIKYVPAEYNPDKRI